MAAGPRDLAGLRQTLRLLPELAGLLKGQGGLLEAPDAAPHGALLSSLNGALVEDPPALLREGGFIQPGYDRALDEAMADGHGAREKVLAVQERERVRSDNPKLKVQFNNVFGYFIEVSKAQAGAVPADYERKQTLVGAERYTTPELKAIEQGSSPPRSAARPGKPNSLRSCAARFAPRPAPWGPWRGSWPGSTPWGPWPGRLTGRLGPARTRRLHPPGTARRTASGLGAHPAGGRLQLRAQRLPSGHRNRTDPPDHRPEHGGQVHLHAPGGPHRDPRPMRQLRAGRAARIGLVDRIFTRVGASDRARPGQSTFMVEMTETANILGTPRRRSLVDPRRDRPRHQHLRRVAIAWAVAEHLHESPALGCRTLFATHYFELAELEKRLPRVRNYCVAVRQWEGKIVFLHSIRPGASEHSYGVAVARLAGVPEPVLKRAREVLQSLELQRREYGRKDGEPRTLDLFATPADPALESLAERLRALDCDAMTPLQALKELADMKKSLDAGSGAS